MKIDPAIAVPLLLLAGASAWKAVAVDPGWRADRMALLSARSFQAETDRLRLACSDAQAAAVRREAGAWRAVVLPEGAALAAGQRLVSEAAAQAGWTAAFAEHQTGDGFVTWKVRLQPMAKNSKPWRSLVAFGETLQGQHRQIGLTQLAVRADEQGRYTADGWLRMPYVLPHEEISQ